VDIAYGTALDVVGRSEEGIARLIAARETLRRLTHPRFVLCSVQLMMALNRHGRLDETIAIGLDTLDVGTAWGATGHWWMTSAREVLAWSAYQLGRWDLAASHGALAVELTRAGGDALPFAALAVHLGRGELDSARELLSVARALLRLGPGFRKRHLEQVAELALLEGRYDDAFVAARDGIRTILGTGSESRSGRLLLLAARALADAGDGSGSRRQAAEGTGQAAREAELLELAAAATTGPCGERPASDVIAGDAVRAQWAAELSRLRGSSDPYLWSEAAAQWRHLRRPYAEAYCLLRAAEAAVARRLPRSSAQEPLQSAARIAQELAATPLLEQVTGLAERARLPLPAAPVNRSAPDQYGLTAREREVLALLAAGLTNAELASRLFISTHTANVHVSRILMKLGVPNRTRAASLAWAEGLAGQA
jgi:DNA-binding CsgD family transcriptional regulator